MNYPTDTIAEDIRDGGLAHFQRTLDTLGDDFSRLDETIRGLAGTLNVTLQDASSAVHPDPEPRSVIEHATRRVRWLQECSERQRGMIEQIREAIQ